MDWIHFRGIGFVALLLLPNLLFAFLRPGGFENRVQNRAVELCEQIGRFGCLILMLVCPPVVCRGFWFAGGEWLYHFLGIALVGLYELGWIVFWREDSLRKALALSILPSLLFLESAVLLGHFPLLACALLFAPCHIYISAKNALLARKGES